MEIQEKSSNNPLYKNLSPEETKILQEILDEIAVGGKSFTLEQLKKVGFKEQPADLDTFLDDERYLGVYTDKGTEIYPEWRKELKDIFSGKGATRCKYSEIFVSGATRIGKTTLACYGVAYMQHILQCMDKPQRRYKISSFSVINILFFNVTKDMAEGVAFRQYNDMLMTSPWFLKHGKFSKSEANPRYLPSNRAIRLLTGSAAVGGRHALGRQIFCLTGDTEIITDKGVIPIEKLDNKAVNVLQYNDKTQEKDWVEATVAQTGTSTQTIRITLEDGSVIEGTPEHRVMLADGSYKELQNLTEEDDIMTPNKSYSVYVHTTPSNKRYVGITKQKPNNRWKNGKGYRSNKHFWNAIEKYGWDNIQHEIIQSGLTVEEACTLEQNLIKQHNSFNPEFGYNQTSGGVTPTELSVEAREKISEYLRQRWLDPEYRERQTRLASRPCTEARKQTISKARTGIKHSKSHGNKGGNLSEEHKAKLRGNVAWNKGKSKETDKRVATYASKLRNQKASDETRLRQSAAQQKRIEARNGFKPFWMNDGSTESFIESEQQFEQMAALCWRKGRLPKIYVHDGHGVSKRILQSELVSCLNEGWLRGRGKLPAISNAHIGNTYRKGTGKK